LQKDFQNTFLQSYVTVKIFLKTQNLLIKFRGVKMKKFDQEEFNNFILENNVIGFFKEPIKLKSGRMSNWYVNWRKPTNDAFLLNEIAQYIISWTEQLFSTKNLESKPDCFYGVPEGATKLAIITQHEWAKQSENYAKGSHSIPMGRAKPKEHGDPKDKYFVGLPHGKTIIIEDVTTTGNSLLKTIDNLKEAGIRIIAAYGLTNRMEKRDDGLSVSEAVKAKGVNYLSLSNALELLPKAYAKLQPGEEIAKAIEEEFKKYGVQELKLL